MNRILAAIFALLAAVAGASVSAREQWSAKAPIALAAGDQLIVEHNGSQRTFVGHPHVFGFGGGDPRHELKFARDGVAYVWKGPFIPVVLDFDGATPVLVVFDRETDFAHVTYRYYRYEKKTWKQRPLETFPRQLALQNMWLTKNNAEDQFETVRLRDPESDYFRRSLTARLWYCMVNGKQYWQVESQSIPSEFLRDYKNQYLQPASK